MKLATLVSLLAASAAISATQDADVATLSPLILEQTIPLPGVKGKFDHLAIDVA